MNLQDCISNEKKIKGELKDEIHMLKQKNNTCNDELVEFRNCRQSWTTELACNNETLQSHVEKIQEYEERVREYEKQASGHKIITQQLASLSAQVQKLQEERNQLAAENLQLKAADERLRMESCVRDRTIDKTRIAKNLQVISKC